MLQKVETAHLSHLNIRDYATDSGKGTGLQKLFRGFVAFRFVSKRSQEICERFKNSEIVIYDRDRTALHIHP
jgi:hypothetical protein